MLRGSGSEVLVTVGKKGEKLTVKEDGQAAGVAIVTDNSQSLSGTA